MLNQAFIHATKSSTHQIDQVANKNGTNGGLLVIVLDVDIDDVHRRAALLVPVLHDCKK